MKCGTIAFIGRPNVGKSTLLNHLLGQKISITSRKPQTTRHRILGIKTTELGQAVYVDTPGMHKSEKKALNRYLNRTATTTLVGVDVVVWVTDIVQWHEYDESIFAMLKSIDVPVIFVINKIDRVANKETCLPFLEEVSRRYTFASIIPISALRKINLEELEQHIMSALPEGEMMYPGDQISDRPERFFAAEIIREKLIRRLAKELPYAITVEIEQYIDEAALVKINAIIWIESESQKAIVVGKKGAVLKTVGQQAREDLERMLDKKVFLQCWVKVKKGWSDSERILQSLGYD